jgi:hypothetical protein
VLATFPDPKGPIRVKILNPFRRRPRRQDTRREVAAIRAKTSNARRQLAETDAMLADRPGPDHRR